MKRILLVDDSTDFLKILAQALERDFEVHTATGVSEAMAINWRNRDGFDMF